MNLFLVVWCLRVSLFNMQVAEIWGPAPLLRSFIVV